jgi:hypothetical protein
VAIQDSLVENAMSVRGRVVVVVALAGVLARLWRGRTADV